MSAARLMPRSLRGLSFSIADLVLLRSWAEAQDLRMTIHLDHGVEGEEYEEVVALSRTERSLSQWIIWHDGAAVFAQPLIGRTQCHESVADVIEALSPKLTVKLTDIQATHWPRSSRER
jgi:hypothetical protein